MLDSRSERARIAEQHAFFDSTDEEQKALFLDEMAFPSVQDLPDGPWQASPALAAGSLGL